jgi:hypothetical protein
LGGRKRNRLGEFLWSRAGRATIKMRSAAMRRKLWIAARRWEN